MEEKPRPVIEPIEPDDIRREQPPGIKKKRTSLRIPSNCAVIVEGQLDVGKGEIIGLPKGEAVADAAGSAPTAAEFKALLNSLRDAGIIATAAAAEDGK